MDLTAGGIDIEDVRRVLELEAEVAELHEALERSRQALAALRRDERQPGEA